MDVQIEAALLGATATIVGALLNAAFAYWLATRRASQKTDSAPSAAQGDPVASDKRKNLLSGTSFRVGLVIALAMGVFTYLCVLAQGNWNNQVEQMNASSQTEFWNSSLEARTNYHLRPITNQESWAQGTFAFISSSELRPTVKGGLDTDKLFPSQNEEHLWEVAWPEGDFVRLNGYITPPMIKKLKDASSQGAKKPIKVEVNIYPKPLKETVNLVSIPIHRLVDIKARILGGTVFAQVTINVGQVKD